MSADLEARLDALYAAPLSGFVKERDAIAAELKKAGDKPRAAEVKKLARPSLGAWALNQAWRTDRAAYDELLAAGEALRDAQRATLAGAGADALKEAQRTRRAAVRRVAGVAREALVEGGHADAPATVARIEATLDAIATNPDGQPLGRLVNDVEVDALAALVALAPDDLGAAPAPRPAAPVAARAQAAPAAPAPPADDGRAARVAEARRDADAKSAALATGERAAAAALAASREAERVRNIAAADAATAKRDLAVVEAAVDKARAHAASMTTAAERAARRFEEAKADADAKATVLEEARAASAAARAELERRMRA